MRPVILTTGLFTYTSDQRFSAKQRSMTDSEKTTSFVEDTSLSDWVLQIKFVQSRDAGIYECQISTEPQISEDFQLKIVGRFLIAISLRT